jgi:hypothetical protein
MKASETVKSMGLKSLKQVAEITGRSEQTLIQWHKLDIYFFKIVVLGCVSAATIDRANNHLGARATDLTFVNSEDKQYGK